MLLSSMSSSHYIHSLVYEDIPIAVDVLDKAERSIDYP